MRAARSSLRLVRSKHLRCCSFLASVTPHTSVASELLPSSTCLQLAKTCRNRRCRKWEQLERLHPTLV